MKPIPYSQANISQGLVETKDFLLASESKYEQVLVKDLVLPGADLHDLQVLDTEFVGCRLQEGKIKDARFKQVRFTDTDLANVQFTEARFENVDFVGCRMTGLKAIEGIFQDVLFYNCQLKLSQFRMAKFRRKVIFKKCILEEADFYGAELGGVVFEDCDLLKAEFSHTKLNKTDFRTSKLAGVKVDIESLKGTLIEPSQVNDLAHLLGAEISWKGE